MTEKHTIADYGDFEIHVKQTTSDSKLTLQKISQVELKYRRKRQMVEKGILSKEAGRKIEEDYRKDLIEVYVDCIIVGWKGKFKGTELPEYNRENAIKFFDSKDGELILVDITEVSLAQNQIEQEAESEIEKEEIKN